MQQQATTKITTIEELERVHLRFIKVNDDKRLSDILAKILPSMLKIFLEQDLAQANDLENNKIKQLEETMTHLLMRVQNSQGKVKVPVTRLLEIYTSSEYYGFTNQTVKRHAEHRINQFVTETLKQSAKETQKTIDIAQNVDYLGVLSNGLASKQQSFNVKAWFLCLLMQRITELSQEQKKEDDKNTILNDILIQVFNSGADEKANKSRKNALLQMCLLFNIASAFGWPNALNKLYFDNWVGVLESIFMTKEKCLMQTQQSYRQIIEKTTMQAILKYTDIFTMKETLPLLLIASCSSAFASCKDLASSHVKSTVNSAIDFNNDKTVSYSIYQLLLGNFFIYNSEDFQNSFNEDVLHPQTIPVVFQQHLIDYLMKFGCAMDQHPLNIQLVKQCLFGVNSQQMQSHALLFMRTLIQSQQKQISDEFLHTIKTVLFQVREDYSGIFREETKAMNCLLIAELAQVNFQQVIGQDISIAVDTFNKLREQITHLEKIGGTIRQDDLCLTYMETLNKFRDSFQNEELTPEQKQLLLSFVINFLDKESVSSSGELVYILFLYISQLDKHSLNTKVLLYAILLKDHSDIKIRKEAQTQLEAFQQITKATNNPNNKQLMIDEDVLQSFFNDIGNYFVRNNSYVIRLDGEDLQKELSFNSNQQFNLDFIEKTLQLTDFAYKFYEHLNYPTKFSQQIERILLMNVNLNYTQLKTDFMEPLQLIKKYITHDQLKQQSQMNSVGLHCVYKLSRGANCNLNQKIQCMKIMYKLIGKPDLNNPFMKMIEQEYKSIATQTKHEAKLNKILLLTLLSSATNSFQLESLINDILNEADKNLSPNLQEQIKLGVASLSIVEGVNSDQMLDILKQLALRKELDINFRKNLIKQMNSIVRKCSDDQVKQQFIEEVFENIKQYDNSDLQPYVGTMLIKTILDSNNHQKLTQYLHKLLMSINGELKQQKLDTESHEEQIVEEKKTIQAAPLTVKRNNAIYINQIILHFNKKQNKLLKAILSNPETQIQIQTVFIKFLFDRRALMQDMATQALSIFHDVVMSFENQQNTDTLVNHLVQAFQPTVASTTPVVITSKDTKEDTKPEQKSEGSKTATGKGITETNINHFVMNEFRDNTSIEQKIKHRLYKDLACIATDMSHPMLLYKFLLVQKNSSDNQPQSCFSDLSQDVKDDLRKNAQLILLLSYDSIDQVRNIMKELWYTIVSIQEEKQFIQDIWTQVYDSAAKVLQAEQGTNRPVIRTCLMLSDLMQNKTWQQLNKHFRVIFLASLALLDSPNDSVKVASYQLVKTIKSITLKFANILTNNQIQELEEVLGIVIPMILNDCLKSTIKPVRLLGIDTLSQILKSSQSQQLSQQLKIQNKYERQLAFSYNSSEKMKTMLNKYLGQITISIIVNLSSQNKIIEEINMIEQMMADQKTNTPQSGQTSGKQGISETQINDLRMKFSKDSVHGEILKICRDMMTVETFDSIVNELIKLMKSGHDISTKSTATQFVSDIILENNTQLITPQNSRKVATKLVEIFSQQSTQAALSVKESLVQLYASCIGLQMKILHKFPNTCQQLFDSIVGLPSELEMITCTIVYEIIKSLPEHMLKEPLGQKLLAKVVPIVHINKLKTQDQKLRALSKRVFGYIDNLVPKIMETNSEAILQGILQNLDSNQYDDRVASAYAMQELCHKLSEDQLIHSQTVKQIIQKQYSLIKGKYFNNKEDIVECFDQVMGLLGTEGMQAQQELMQQYMETCVNQIEKSSSLSVEYKTAIIKSLQFCLTNDSDCKFTSYQQRQQIFDVLIGEVGMAMQQISETASLIENEYEETKEQHKHQQNTITYSLQCLSELQIDSAASIEMICDMCTKFYSITNWQTRNAIQKFTNNKLNKLNQMPIINLGCHIIGQTVKLGEKYDSNLEQISDIALNLTELLSKSQEQHQQSISQLKATLPQLISILNEKSTDILTKNVSMLDKFVKSN